MEKRKKNRWKGADDRIKRETRRKWKIRERKRCQGKKTRRKKGRGQNKMEDE